MARNMLSDDERARIRAAVSSVEQQTHARFVLTIVPVSGRYALYPLVLAGLIAMAAGAVLAAGWPTMALRTAFLIQAVAFIAVSLVFEWKPFRLMLVSRRSKQAHVANLARREFASHILAQSDHRRGVVFFVSLGERCAEILADRELHQLAGPDRWQQIVDRFTQGIRDGRTAESYIEAVTACGAILAAHYPRSNS
jgi:putative membrane protein